MATEHAVSGASLHARRLRQRVARTGTAAATLRDQCRDQLQRSSDARREVATLALAIAKVEDAIAANLDALAGNASSDHAASRSRLADEARAFAAHERALAARYLGSREPH